MKNHPVYKTWMALMAKEEKTGYVGLTDAEQDYWCVYLLDMEIYNGFFDQYFVNSSSDYEGERYKLRDEFTATHP